MPRFVEGLDRHQVTLLPECLDDFVTEDNPVRVIEAFVDELDLAALGFEGARAAATGRPGYHPSVLLKIYLYGYINRVQSSRRLERESQRNVELMWLTGRLAPDFKTIADFRRDNGPGIRNTCRRFIELCRQLKLFSQAVVAVDGSKFKAVNSRDQNFTVTKMQRRREQLEQHIERYLSALDTADRVQEPELAAKTERLNDKIEYLRQQMRELDAIAVQVKAQPDGQISKTDPDARAMSTHSKVTGVVGYNVQAAVDAEHHLIVAHEVTNVGHDRAQLHPMAKAAKQAMGLETVEALGDRGYFNGVQIKACDDDGIAATVPKPMTSNAKAEGRFHKGDFIYIASDDEYLCPAGQRATYRFTREEDGLNIRRYWSSACSGCPIKAQCTPSPYRRISRWEHEHMVEAVQRRLDQNPMAMRVRRQTVEHVFGTLKHWMGSTHFLTRTLRNVGTEMSLHVLAYNFKRVLSILGMTKLMQGLREASA